MKFKVALYNKFFDEKTVSKLQDFSKKLTGDCACLINPNESTINCSTQNDCTIIELLQSLCKIAKESNANAIIFAWSDCPFLNFDLSQELIKLHAETKAEYSFVDGYPLGLTPEIIDVGTLNILLQLAKNDEKNASLKVNRTSIFDLLKKDINQFEVETLISDKDFRLLRLEFCNGTKEGKILCERLKKLVLNKCVESSDKLDSSKNLSATELCTLAQNDAQILHLLPSFYNIQISLKCHASCDYCPYPAACQKKYNCSPRDFANSSKPFMSFTKFQSLVKNIAAFSETGVISLSLWGEPLLHPQIDLFVKEILQYEGFSVLLETSGTEISEELANKIKAFCEEAPKRTNGYPPIIWICSLDAATSETYCKLHKDAFITYEKALQNAAMLENLFGEYDGVKSVYRQFVRLNENENELETFYRSNNNRLIQKYDNFQNRLPSRKPADLTPINRYPCWHLRKDLCVLIDGSVPLCREHIFESIIGNAFDEPLIDIWQESIEPLQEQINCKYKGLCADCDEYYTFNF